MKYLLNWLAIS